MADMAGIVDPVAELLIWQRTLPEDLENWLGRLDAFNLLRLRVLVRPDQVRAALVPFFDHAGHDPAARLLAEDIENLVTLFARVTASEHVDIRIEPVLGDACWKFHRDNVSIRLVTSYKGPSTEWVLPEHAQRALEDQRAYDGPLEQLGKNDVAVFKGSSSGAGRGIVHRSPAIEGTGQARVLLCLNLPSLASPDPWEPA